MNRAEQLRRFQPIKRLRRIRGYKEPEPSDVQKAVRRWATTPEGEVMLNWLWARTHGRIMPTDASDSALREHAGARKLADEILRMVETTHDG